jgi:hypothetical protein
VSPRKSEQEQWLAEAANALAEAERLTGLLALGRPRNDLALAALQAEIMALRREIELLQRERAGERRRDFHPDWLEYSVWAPVR